ncbi:MULTISPECIES: GNAT family N-acetyltransferase [Streptomyces]|uniref:Phosphinothricin acetyltransferase n=1 Tax=Streptomyces clavifer TaxID=68188 RepID=A0ABS4VA78_9ACTN|nr:MULTISPECIES: GNAT family N-acetyltransferase [Streptomyces]KQX90776.1 GCN5 family acetyltransferase [Streptomyces sp. Root1319]KQZ03471.1 GCN5 family acetyltransferase [Streptomyces sp. Root55]MBP2360801.1 phosphinothricin acetyltransferase [Streptomyces clavifer]MDX2746025.1 GNAT family N-acetyltransferase [Streptomyces sp. NRRL_B-2557]WUC28385.1 GNAT family N-acetyltransferase [Streptomyces clavifer]
MSRIPTEVQVRPGSEADLEAVTAIYNHYVRETALTFDTTAFTPAERLPWLRSHPEDGPFRLLVASHISPSRNAPEVLGYATSSPYRPKAAYSTSVEVSAYCAPGTTGRGVGTLLYKALFEALAGEDIHRAYAAIAQPNEPSVRLHGAFGFRHVGTYTEVGRKFGRYWDVSWYEKPMLSRTGPSASPDPSRTPR